MKAKNLEFRSYKLEMDQILGEFDGSAMKLTPHVILDRAILKHEIVHSYISRSLPDGILVVILVFLHSKDNANATLGILADKFFKESETAQEVAATFLGALTTERNDRKRQKLLKKFNSDYRSYFERYASIVNGLSWITQYTVCYAITNYVFSSPALSFLKKESLNLSALNDDELLPDIRLKKMLKWFTSERCKELVASVNQSIENQQQAGNLPQPTQELTEAYFRKDEELHKFNRYVSECVKFASLWLKRNAPLETLSESISLREILSDEELVDISSGAVKQLARGLETDGGAGSSIDELYSDAILRSALYVHSKNSADINCGSIKHADTGKLEQLKELKRTSFLFVIEQKGRESQVHILEHFWSHHKIKLRTQAKIYNTFKSHIRDGFRFLSEVTLARQAARRFHPNEYVSQMPKASMVIFRAANIIDSQKNALYAHYAHDVASEIYRCPYHTHPEDRLRARFELPHLPIFPIIWYLDTEIEMVFDFYNDSTFFWKVHRINRHHSAFVVHVTNVSGLFLKILPNAVIKTLKNNLTMSSVRNRLHKMSKHESASLMKKDIKSAIEKIECLWEEF